MMKWQKRLLLGGFITVLVLTGGCTSNRSSVVSHPYVDDTGQQLVILSRDLVGSPYRYGGQSPNGFDCSGLVRYVYGQVGITVPHSSQLLYKNAQKVDLDNIRPGDLLFFRVSKEKISHVGIYTTNGEFIHAPSSGKYVTVARLDNPYWEQRLVGAGRFH